MSAPRIYLERIMRYSKDKDISALVSNVLNKGWHYQRGSKHGSIFSPKGSRLIVPTTPSDRRAYYNFRNQLRKIANKESLAHDL